MSKSVDWYMDEYDGPDSKGYDLRQKEIELVNK